MPFEFDFQNTVIEAGSADISIQEFVNAIRLAEATVSGIVFPHIVDATGKQTLADLGDGELVEVGITADLKNGWQVHFLAGNYTVTIEGGNLVGGLGGDPVSYSAGVQVILIQSAASTLVTAAGGSGLSQAEHDQLFALPDEDVITDAIWDESLTGLTHNIPTSAGRRLRQLGDVFPGSVVDASPTASSFTTSIASNVNGFYNDQYIRFTSGDLEGQVRIVSGYAGSTKRIYVDEDWTSVPANGDEFDLIPVHIHPQHQVVSGVWSEPLSGYTVSGSAGNTLVNANLNTAVLQVDIQDALGLSGENTKWSGLAHDANYNLISAVITQYESDALSVVRKQWQLTATYDVNSQLTNYQLKEY